MGSVQCLQLGCRNPGDGTHKEIEEYRSEERYKLQGAQVPLGVYWLL